MGLERKQTMSLEKAPKYIDMFERAHNVHTRALKEMNFNSGKPLPPVPRK